MTVYLTPKYDPLGRLYEVSAGASNATRFLYDIGAGAAAGVDPLLAEYDATNGGLLRRYVHGPGLDEPLIWYEGADLSNRRTLHANHQGSIIAVADAIGRSMGTNSYDPYGIPGTTNAGRFQYTGQIWLSELGLYHYKARAYSPSLGRFLQTDPIGTKDDLNLYAYVGGDPVNKTDPTGLCAGPLIIPCGVAAVEAAPVVASAATATGTLVGAAILWVADKLSSSPVVTPPVTTPPTAAPPPTQPSEMRGNRGGQGQGERGRTAKPSGTDNPGKHTNPGGGYRTDPHTGKKIPLPPPPKEKPPEPERVPKGKKNRDEW